MSLAPQNATIAVNAPQSFTATVTGAINTNVTWTRSCGIINGSSNTITYTAPSTAGTCTITATSTADPTKSATATVTVTESGPPPTGTITGTITVGPATSAARSGLQASSEAWEMPYSLLNTAPFVPGEIIVGFTQGFNTQSLLPLTVSGVQLSVIQSITELGVQVLSNRSLNEAETLRMIQELQRRPDVRYAQPNYIAQSAAIPNDLLYPLQWHYPAINLPAAWDITKGSPDVVVAVVDTGILHSFISPTLTHPDFVGKVLPGYDFISDFRISGDGGGRDPNPYDNGTNPFGQSSYHGSHVAGTIAAATNNSIGVAGVDWNAKILPIRVLGTGGGTIVDIIEGTLWAAGFSVAGVPNNPNPAHVINLSLGWNRPCGLFEQDVFDLIAASSPRQSIVIAAAGNDNMNAALVAPASCRNVITVGATDYLNRRAPYSNYGSRIDVMAPGGNMAADWNSDGLPDGVLSIWRNDLTGADDYRFIHGTSMAAPHVAGVASLMKALNPNITQAEVRAALQATARPLTASACNRASGAECGAGLIDAAAALALVQNNTIPTPGVGNLIFEPGVLDFGTFSGALNVILRNTGGTPLLWQATEFLKSELNPGNMLDLAIEISDFNGTIPAGGTRVVSLSINRNLVTADGNYVFAVVFEVQGESSPALLHGTFIKANTATPTLSGPVYVAAFIEDETGELQISGVTSYQTLISQFSLETLTGANVVIAWSDENNNEEIDDADYVGVFPDPVNVVANRTTAGVNININGIIDLSMGTTLTPSSLTEPWRSAMEKLAANQTP